MKRINLSLRLTLYVSQFENQTHTEDPKSTSMLFH